MEKAQPGAVGLKHRFFQRGLRTSARWAAACILAWTGGAKLLMPGEFVGVLRETGMLDETHVWLVARGLPPAELLLALLLAVDLLTIPCALITLMLGLTFTGVHLIVLHSGAAQPCGCLGVAFTHDRATLHGLLFSISVVIVFCALGTLFLPRRTA